MSEEEIEAAQAIAIMKVGRHLPRIRALLETMGLTANAGGGSRSFDGAQHNPRGFGQEHTDVWARDGLAKGRHRNGALELAPRSGEQAIPAGVQIFQICSRGVISPYFPPNF